VLIVEWLIFGFRAADEAAVAETDVVDKSLPAEKYYLPGSIGNRTVLGYVRHGDLRLTVGQVAREDRVPSWGVPCRHRFT
jgi:hypothetical protein